MYSFEFDDERTRQALLLCALLEILDSQLGDEIPEGTEAFCFDPANVCDIDSHATEYIATESLLYAEYGGRDHFLHDIEAQNVYVQTLKRALASEESFTNETSFKNLHASLFAGQDYAGEYTAFANKVWTRYDEEMRVFYVGAAPEIKSREIQALFEQYNNLVLEHPKLHAAYACCLLLNCCLVHPFKDGNGRTARFLFTSELYRAGLKHVTQIPLCQIFAPHLVLLYNPEHGWPSEYGQACDLPQSSIALLKLLIRCYKRALSQARSRKTN